MKTMKRFVCAMLTVVLFVSLAAPAMASSYFYRYGKNTEYDTTYAFIQQLDAYDIDYELAGLDDDDNEVVRILFNATDSAKKAYEYTISCYFTGDEQACHMRVFNLINYKTDDVMTYLHVLTECNQINLTYRWAKLFVDTSDNSVTVAMDMAFVGSDDAGAICAQNLVYLTSIAEASYDILRVYKK